MVRIIEAPWQTYQKPLKQLRNEVFVQEQCVPEEEEWDGLDPSAIHLLAMDSSGYPLGTVRLLSSGKVTRMAVRKGARGTGVGSQLLEHACQKLAKQGHIKAKLDAQLHAQSFYERHGFVAEGDLFLDAGIKHVHMTKTLNIKPSNIDQQ